MALHCKAEYIRPMSATVISIRSRIELKWKTDHMHCWMDSQWSEGIFHLNETMNIIELINHIYANTNISIFQSEMWIRRQ
jgi:hypothetical protein